MNEEKQDRSVSQPGGEAMWDLLTEFYQLYINSENLGIEWDAFAEKVGSLVITDKESEAPEGYHWSVPSGKYHDDEPVLRKNRIENTPQPSQPGGGYNVRKEIDWHNANVKMACELEEQLAALRAESQSKDTRIKELEKERDDLAVGFASWMEKHEKSFAYYLDGIEYWTGDITVNQLLEEYKKQLTK